MAKMSAKATSAFCPPDSCCMWYCCPVPENETRTCTPWKVLTVADAPASVIAPIADLVVIASPPSSPSLLSTAPSSSSLPTLASSTASEEEEEEEEMEEEEGQEGGGLVELDGEEEAAFANLGLHDIQPGEE
mmetsp:Transcript_22884/g.38170  ORF Transcript_22884/g.38170 Transcript_22884/m.38170 type:complete len:132 (-) Transcript_22884:198-593(-)